jgi:GMP synthase-like glutamine amidotransferase
MKIGILEAGLIREELADRYERYTVMFERLLDHAERDLECIAYSPVQGQMPESIYDCDGWLITGSRHGVYEQLEWMGPLQDFIREVAAAGLPMIGVCFGHQIMAEAMGGKVIKSDLGWKVGLKHYDVVKTYEWMANQPSAVGIHAWHQDQVVALPPTAEVFLTAEDCPYAGLSYGESMISVQAHPEIVADYERALLDMFTGKLLPDDVVQGAIDSMAGTQSPDTQLLAGWFAEFFLSRKAATSSAPPEQAQSSGI